MKVLGLFQSFFTHWKTSLAGIAVAGLIQWQQGTNLKSVAISAGILFLGLVSHDGDKTNALTPLANLSPEKKQSGKASLSSLVLIFIFASLLLYYCAGCIKRQGTGSPVTAYERVMVWNDALAQTNNSIAQGITQLSANCTLRPSCLDLTPACQIAEPDNGWCKGPQLLPADKAARVLRGQKSIAQLDEQLTLLLKQGPDVAKANAGAIRNLVNQLKASVTSLTNSGVIGVKNPKTQQTFDADISAIGNLIDNIITGLTSAGVIQ